MLKNLGIFIGVIATLMIIGMIINFIRFVARMMINIFIFSFGWSVLGVSKAIENSAPVKFMKVTKNHIIENQVVYLAVLGMFFTYAMYSFIKKKINNSPVEEKEERREVIMGLEE